MRARHCIRPDLPCEKDGTRCGRQSTLTRWRGLRNAFRRAPVNLDGLLAALETGKPMTPPLTANV